MYRTSSDQIRTHEEPWATVFRVGLVEASELIFGMYRNDQRPERFGIAVFDRLTLQQKVAMLAIVGKALLDADTPAPELTAVTEATVAVLLGLFRSATIVESDMHHEPFEDGEDPDPPWRTQCRRAVLGIYAPDWDAAALGPLPTIDDSDAGEWEKLLVGFEELIMWDDDYLMEGPFLDVPAQDSAALKDDLGIDDDYYTAVAPDPSPAQLREYVATISALTGTEFDPEDALD